MNLYVITGSSRGLGAKLVQLAESQGHKVISISRSASPRKHHLQLDLRDSSAAAERLQKELNEINLSQFQDLFLINNAAQLEPIGPSANLQMDQIQASIAINFTAPVLLTTAFLQMTQGFNGCRTIVNVSSGVAERPKAQWSLYSATKAGLRAYSQALANEIGPSERTRVISFNPGIMDTQMQANIRAQTPEQFSEVERFRTFQRDGMLMDARVVAEALWKPLHNPEQKAPFDLSIQDVLP